LKLVVVTNHLTVAKVEVKVSYVKDAVQNKSVDFPIIGDIWCLANLLYLAKDVKFVEHVERLSFLRPKHIFMMGWFTIQFQVFE